MFNSSLVHAGRRSGLRKVLRAEKGVCLHPKVARRRAHACRGALELMSLSVLGGTKLIEPGAVVPRCAHLIEADFGLVGCEKIVQG